MVIQVLNSKLGITLHLYIINYIRNYIYKLRNRTGVVVTVSGKQLEACVGVSNLNLTLTAVAQKRF